MREIEYINLQTGEKLDLNKVDKLKDNAMLKVKPELWVEWDFEKNNELGLDIWKMTKSSAKKVWWICTKCKSSFDMKIEKRNINQKCSFCAGKKVNHTNCLATKNPKLAKQWHPTKNGDLNPHNITSVNSKVIWWYCDVCENEWDTKLSDRKSNDCPYCRSVLLTDSNSFIKNYPHLISEWDYERNDLDINTLRHKSNKVVSWICNKNKNHKWKAEVYSRTSGVGCPYCVNQKVDESNCIKNKNAKLYELLKNKSDGLLYTEGSNVKVDWICPKCKNTVGQKSISNVKNKGLHCHNCDDGMYYPEKMLYVFLKHLEVEFIKEKTFNWSDRKRYDFYIPFHNAIVEVHGEQHYIGTGFEILGGRTVQEEQANDKHKYELAMKNGIEHYIVIDARYSDFEYIKNSILNSELSNLFNLENINWLTIEMNTQNNLIKTIAERWCASKIIKQLANEFNLHPQTVSKYLNRASKLGLCSYSPKESSKNKHLKAAMVRSRSVVMFNHEKTVVFKSITLASKKLKTSISTISNRCSKRRTDIHGYKWMYLEDYEKEYGKIIE